MTVTVKRFFFYTVNGSRYLTLDSRAVFVYCIQKVYKVWFSVYSSVEDAALFLFGQSCDSIKAAHLSDVFD